MSSGKPKISWPVVVLVCAGVALIVLALVQRPPEPQSGNLPGQINTASAVQANPGAPQSVPSASSTTDPVPSGAIVTTGSNTGKEGLYAVQVYSFQDKAKAETAVARLKADGLPAYLLMSDLGAKGIWHRVRVGMYDTADQAKQALEKIQRDYKSGIVVRQ